MTKEPFRWSRLTPSQKIQLSMVLVIGLTCAAWLAVLGVEAARSQADYVEQQVDRTVLKAELEVQRFFEPPIRLLNLSRAWIEVGMLKGFDKPEAFAQAFIPVLESTPQLSQLLICETNGVEVLLSRKEAGWAVRSTGPGKTGASARFTWQDFSAQGEPGTIREEQTSYDARTRPWFAGALEAAVQTNLYWTEVYTFFSSGVPGLTASILCRPPKSDPRILAVDIPLSKVRRLYDRIPLGEQGHLFLLGRDGVMVNLSRAVLENQGEAAAADQLLQAAVAQIQKPGGEAARIFALGGQAQGWWCGLREIRLEGQPLRLGVLLHADQFSRQVRSEQKRILFMMLAIGLAGIVLSGGILRYYLKAVRARAEAGSGRPLPERVAEGESELLEFKSSLRWDYKAQSINKKLEEVILKSIAAFNNGSGGTLLIGVDDEGRALGLEPDMQSLREPDTDHFELHLRNLVSQVYGVEYGAAYLRFSFPELAGKAVCRIDIQAGKQPLYAPVSDKSGRKQEKFFVRSGNASREISALSEVMQYIQSRFNQS